MFVVLYLPRRTLRLHQLFRKVCSSIYLLAIACSIRRLHMKFFMNFCEYKPLLLLKVLHQNSISICLNIMHSFHKWETYRIKLYYNRFFLTFCAYKFLVRYLVVHHKSAYIDGGPDILHSFDLCTAKQPRNWFHSLLYGYMHLYFSLLSHRIVHSMLCQVPRYNVLHLIHSPFAWQSLYTSSISFLNHHYTKVPNTMIKPGIFQNIYQVFLHPFGEKGELQTSYQHTLSSLDHHSRLGQFEIYLDSNHNASLCLR